MIAKSQSKFSVGQVLCTPGALERSKRPVKRPSSFFNGMSEVIGASCAKKTDNSTTKP